MWWCSPLFRFFFIFEFTGVGLPRFCLIDVAVCLVSIILDFFSLLLLHLLCANAHVACIKIVSWLGCVSICAFQANNFLGYSSQFGLILLRFHTIIIITNWSRAHRAKIISNCDGCALAVVCKSQNSMVIITNYIMQKGENENENGNSQHPHER